MSNDYRANLLNMLHKSVDQKSKPVTFGNIPSQPFNPMGAGKDVYGNEINKNLYHDRSGKGTVGGKKGKGTVGGSWLNDLVEEAISFLPGGKYINLAKKIIPFDKRFGLGRSGGAYPEYWQNEDGLKQIIYQYLIKRIEEEKMNGAIALGDSSLGGNMGYGYQDEYNGSSSVPELTNAQLDDYYRRYYQNYKDYNPYKNQVQTLTNVTTPELSRQKQLEIQKQGALNAMNYDRNFQHATFERSVNQAPEDVGISSIPEAPPLEGFGKRRKNFKKMAGGKIGAKKSPWVNFLKHYSRETGIKYSEALKDPEAKRLYHQL